MLALVAFVEFSEIEKMLSCPCLKRTTEQEGPRLSQKGYEQVSELVTEAMGKAADLDVALKVDLGVGENWDQAH